MQYDVIIIGAGAAGLMCAIEAGKRGRKVLLLDHAKTVGKKIRISGGGRCNFTNLHASPNNYLSNNPHFCISALKRYTQFDFIALVERYGIAYHEKTLGQLFCDGSAQQIIDMLLSECEIAGVEIRVSSDVSKVRKQTSGYKVSLSGGEYFESSSLVISTGGPAIPKMGATGWGYDVAKQFGMNVIKAKAGLVPFTLKKNVLEEMIGLSGVCLDAIASCKGVSFREGILFTHRGLSGPVILQISSYWEEGDVVNVNLLPDIDVLEKLKSYRQSNPKQDVQSILTYLLPKKLSQYICISNGFKGKLADLSNRNLEDITGAISNWEIVPNGTEGFRTAEVCMGGVDTNELSSKNLESKKNQGLYFIGEVADVTGHLGGFNFQWAWSSGVAAGQSV